MRFGLHYLLSCAETQSAVERYRDTIEQAVHAEALGFESVWPVEQHFDAASSISPCPTMLLAAIAARTSTLRLGTAIVQLSLCNPLRVAEQIATLDVISNGRAELGVGRGGNPAHFAGFNVPLAESRERTTEALAFLRLALREDSFSFKGRFFCADDVRLAPRPVQGPAPTIRMAANSMESAQQAGQGGLPILVAAHVHTFAKLGALLAAYHQARREAGHAPACPDDISVLMPLYVGESLVQIERELAPSIQHYLDLLAALSANLLERTMSDCERAKLLAMLQQMRNTDFARVNGTMGVFDTPRGCVERLRALQAEIGMGRVIGWFNMGGLAPHDCVMRSMELFSTEVMPAFAMARAA